MPVANFADRLAVSEEPLDWVRKHQGSLKGNGINPEYWIGTFGPTVESCKEANTAQEFMKAQLKNQTALVNKWDRQMYQLASSLFDVIGGACGKASAEAQQVRRLRGKLHRPPLKNPPS